MMKSPSYRERWSRLMKGTPRVEELTRLSRQVAYSFLDYYLKDCRFEEDYIDLLCEMTTFSEDPGLNSPGTQALFNIIIEGLCDDFEELQTDTYNRVMAQIISYCRSIPAGKEIDETLKGFKIFSAGDLLERTRRIRQDAKSLPSRGISKILLLSRVTIGADVAITSVIIQRLHKLYPAAGIVIIGSPKLKEVYGANSSVAIREVPYSRQGGMLERLSSWHSVLQVIADERASTPAAETVLLDPDSRLSQLGVLPLVPEDRYYFFDSRSAGSFSSSMSMVELTNNWIDRLTGERHFCYPSVWTPEEYVLRAAEFCAHQRASGTKKFISLNFGVGGNRRKSLSRNLEERLLLSLLEEPDTLIVLDKGFGDEEVSYTNSIITKVQHQGHRTLHARLDAGPVEGMKHGLIGMESTIGEMAALIAQCDEFIGYDSACQHIAAAVKTPCITIFAGSNNMRFIRRWSAHGRKGCSIVHIDTLNDPSLIDIDDIISRIMLLRGIQRSGDQR